MQVFMQYVADTLWLPEIDI